MVLGVEPEVWSLIRCNLVDQWLIAWSHELSTSLIGRREWTLIFSIVFSTILLNWPFLEFIHQAAQRVIDPQARSHLNFLLAFETSNITVRTISIGT